MPFEEQEWDRVIPLVYLDLILKQLKNSNVFSCPLLGSARFGIRVNVRISNGIYNGVIAPYWISNDNRRMLIKNSAQLRYSNDVLFEDKEVRRYIPLEMLPDIKKELVFSNVFSSSPLGNNTQGYSVRVRQTRPKYDLNGRITFYLLNEDDRKVLLASSI